MRSYLNSWKEIDGNPREVKRNGFERVLVSFGVKMTNQGLRRGIYRTTARNASFHLILSLLGMFYAHEINTTHVVQVSRA